MQRFKTEIGFQCLDDVKSICGLTIDPRFEHLELFDKVVFGNTVWTLEEATQLSQQANFTAAHREFRKADKVQHSTEGDTQLWPPCQASNSKKGTKGTEGRRATKGTPNVSLLVKPAIEPGFKYTIPLRVSHWMGIPARSNFGCPGSYGATTLGVPVYTERRFIRSDCGLL